MAVGNPKVGANQKGCRYAEDCVSDRGQFATVNAPPERLRQAKVETNHKKVADTTLSDAAREAIAQIRADAKLAFHTGGVREIGRLFCGKPPFIRLPNAANSCGAQCFRQDHPWREVVQVELPNVH
jgi:hypothetical protein